MRADRAGLTRPVSTAAAGWRGQGAVWARMWSLLLALGLAGGLVVSASVAAKADDSVTNLIGSFGECAKTNKSANVLLLIDQSSSLSGDGGSDPDNVRRQAATDFVGQPASYASKNNIDVSVMASGFHGNYTPGSWAKVGSADGEKQELQDVEQVANESSGQETDYWNALEGHARIWPPRPAPATSWCGSPTASTWWRERRTATPSPTRTRTRVRTARV